MASAHTARKCLCLLSDGLASAEHSAQCDYRGCQLSASKDLEFDATMYLSMSLFNLMPFSVRVFQFWRRAKLGELPHSKVLEMTIDVKGQRGTRPERNQPIFFSVTSATKAVETSAQSRSLPVLQASSPVARTCACISCAMVVVMKTSGEMLKSPAMMTGFCTAETKASKPAHKLAFVGP